MDFLFGLFIILLNVVIINYIYKLNKIKCGIEASKAKKYIFHYSLLYVFFLLTLLLVPEYYEYNLSITLLIKFIIGLGGIINVYYLYSFSQFMKDYKCGDMWQRSFMEYYSYFYILMIVFSHIYLYSFYIRNRDIVDSIRNGNQNTNMIKKINGDLNYKKNLKKK